MTSAPGMTPDTRIGELSKALDKAQGERNELLPDTEKKSTKAAALKAAGMTPAPGWANVQHVAQTAAAAVPVTTTTARRRRGRRQC